jgi:hypothetical protein
VIIAKQGSQIKIDGWNHHEEDKREGQRKGQKMRQPVEPRKGESYSKKRTSKKGQKMHSLHESKKGES